MRHPPTPSVPAGSDRRGVALVLTLVLTFAMGALAMAAIYLSDTAGMVGRMGEREKELRYAADAALQIGKSRLNNDPSALPDSGFDQLVAGGTVMAADGTPIPGVTFHLWAGPTGSTTGQFGRFGSVVAEAIGPRGARFVRRLELQQESFARYAYWTNNEKDPGGGTIYFGGGDVLWGPVWSNDVITIHSTGATFHDEVGTAKTVSQAGYGTFNLGYSENENAISLPTVTSLSKLPGYASAGSLNFVAPSSGGPSTVRMRLEFVAVDLNNDGDSTDVDEGFVRVYEANVGQEAWLRGNWNGTKASAVNCGDFHRVSVGGSLVWQFYPVAVHASSGASTAWARTQWQSGGMTSTQASNHGGLTLNEIMSAGLAIGQPAHRCFPGGDPHLVAIERNALGGVPSGQVGGDPTTFTGSATSAPLATRGHWKPWPGAIDPRLLAKRPEDAQYLFPLYRGQNPGYKGVIYANGTVGVSGTLRGRITLYGASHVVIVDDLRYATDPSGGSCNDMLGVIASQDITVLDNAINTPQNVGTTRNFDDTKDLYLHGVMMALSESFTVENYNSGPTNANGCQGTAWGRGCLYLLGGLIQERRGAVGLSNGSGFLKRYSYDRCAVRIPPPYFPTTGRFTDNRYSELDPARFNVTQLFQSLSPNY
jgi:hypothetical protein